MYMFMCILIIIIIIMFITIIIIIITIIIIVIIISIIIVMLGEMEGAPRNPAPRSHLLVRIVKQSGCHCTDGYLTGGLKHIVECRPRFLLPLSPTTLASMAPSNIIE